MEQSTKMRIKTYDPEFKILGDRLVEQGTELRIGPKEPHTGPITLEFNLVSQEDVDAMIEYIKKLKGDLPIVVGKPKEKTSKALNEMLSEKEPLLDLLKTLKAKCKTQEDLINTLREYNFRFLGTQFVMDYGKDKLTLKDKHSEFQWMARLMKEAKVPENDKYDYRLTFGIKFVGERIDRVHIYLWGKWEEKWALPWKTKTDINFKKVEKVYVFPDFMDYAERRKWRQEHRKLETTKAKGGEELEPSKFYSKMKPYVKGY